MNFCTVVRLQTQNGANAVMVVFYALCVNGEFVFLPRILVVFSPFASCLEFLNSNIDTVMNSQYLETVPGKAIFCQSYIQCLMEWEWNVPCLRELVRAFKYFIVFS